MTRQWSTLTRILVLAVSLLFIMLVFYLARPMVGPIVVAALLAYLLQPFTQLVERHTRLRHQAAVSLVYFLFLVVLVATPGTLIPLLIRQARNLSQDMARLEAQLEEFLASPLIIAGRQVHLDELWADFLLSASEFLTPAAEDALRVLETTSISLAWLLVILVTTYYFLVDWERLRGWFVGLFPVEEQNDVYRLIEEINAIWQAYLHGTLVLMLLVGGLSIVVWTTLGLPGSVALGLLSGLLVAIPELGPVIAGVLVTLVALFQGSHFLPLPNFWFAIVIAITHFLLIQVRIYWIQPRVVKRVLQLNTGLVFVAVVGAIVSQGILIAIIIPPLLATFGVLGRYVRARLLDRNPWPGDETGALATDYIIEEAEAVVEERETVASGQ